MKMKKILAVLFTLAFALSACTILPAPAPDDRDDPSSVSGSEESSESGSVSSESSSSEESDEPDSSSSESSGSESVEESSSEESSEPEEDPAEVMLDTLEGFWNDKESNLFVAFTELAGEYFFTTGLWNSDRPESFHITGAELEDGKLTITVHYPRTYDDYNEEWIEAWDTVYQIDCSKVGDREISFHYGDDQKKDLVYIGDSMENAYSYFEENMAAEIYGW